MARNLKTFAAGVLLGTCFSPALAQVDLQIVDLPDIVHNGNVGGVHGYSLGFTLCNNGTVPASWQSSTNQHPIQSWGLFRILPGRIEQIGTSWIKHGNFAASSPGCGTCNTTINGARLGPGCRDTYDATYNSFQYGLGPRADINASTGAFPYPPTIGYTQTGSATFKHCQVADADLLGQPPEMLLVAVGLIVQPEDAAAGNALNNVSYRLLNLSTPSLDVSMRGATVRGACAVLAWRDNALGAGQPDPSITVSSVDVPGDGRVWVASKATDLGGGVWRYEYAIENQNSNRAVGAVIVPLGSAATPSNLGFHGVQYHSGERISSAAWTAQTLAGPPRVRWSTEEFVTNPNGNAIRWGTLYNVRIDVHAPPGTGQVELGLFRPGTPTSVNVGAVVPSAPTCAADFNTVGGVTVQDIFDFLSAWFALDPRADVNGVGGITVQDVFDFLSAWFAGCP